MPIVKPPSFLRPKDDPVTDEAPESDQPSPAPVKPAKEKVYAIPQVEHLSQKEQLGEDFAAIRDICERLTPLVRKGKYSQALDIICRNLRQCCDQMKFYQPTDHS